MTLPILEKVREAAEKLNDAKYSGKPMKKAEAERFRKEASERRNEAENELQAARERRDQDDQDMSDAAEAVRISGLDANEARDIAAKTEK